MGGKVEVTSELGKGTSFIINLKTHCIVKDLKINEIKQNKFEVMYPSEEGILFIAGDEDREIFSWVKGIKKFKSNNLDLEFDQKTALKKCQSV
jgi:hypothetical protein